MKWIKQVIIDILVTVVIAVAVLIHVHWLQVIVLAYTGIVLLLRILTLFSEGFISSGKLIKNNVPQLFYHIIYGVNVVLVLLASWWYATGGWILIWLLSYLYYQKNTRRVNSSKKKK